MRWSKRIIFSLCTLPVASTVVVGIKLSSQKNLSINKTEESKTLSSVVPESSTAVKGTSTTQEASRPPVQQANKPAPQPAPSSSQAPIASGLSPTQRTIMTNPTPVATTPPEFEFAGVYTEKYTCTSDRYIITSARLNLMPKFTGQQVKPMRTKVYIDFKNANIDQGSSPVYDLDPPPPNQGWNIILGSEDSPFHTYFTTGVHYDAHYYKVHILEPTEFTSPWMHFIGDMC